MYFLKHENATPRRTQRGSVYLSGILRGRLLPAPPCVSFGCFGQMSLHVQCEVVRSREGAFTHGALERFGASVLAVVSCQLIGPREPPLALRPLASVRLLAWA